MARSGSKSAIVAAIWIRVFGFIAAADRSSEAYRFPAVHARNRAPAVTMGRKSARTGRWLSTGLGGGVRTMCSASARRPAARSGIDGHQN
jgi:hypothetical protein